MNTLSKFMNTTITFLREVRTELKKTSFPSRQVTVRNTLIVIAFSVAVALFLGGLDMFFSYLLTKFAL